MNEDKKVVDNWFLVALTLLSQAYKTATMRRIVQNYFRNGYPMIKSTTTEDKKRESKWESFGSEFRERESERERESQLPVRVSVCPFYNAAR